MENSAEGMVESKLHPSTYDVDEEKSLIEGQNKITQTKRCSCAKSVRFELPSKNSNRFLSKSSQRVYISFTTPEKETNTQWSAKKSEENQIQKNKKVIDNRKQIESEKKLQRQKNFEKWFETKRKQEYTKKIEQLQERIKTEAQKELDRERKNFQNNLVYQTWLLKKRQEEKEKKLQEQLETKQTNRKQQCQIKCGNSNETISSKTIPSKDALRKKRESNLVKNAESRKSEMQMKKSNRFLSKSSEKVNKSSNSSNSVSIDDASDNQKKTANASLKRDDPSHDDDKRKQIESEKNLLRKKNFEKWFETKKMQAYTKKNKQSQELIKTEAQNELDREEKNLLNHVKYQAWLERKQQEEKSKHFFPGNDSGNVFFFIPEKELQEQLRKYQAEIYKVEKIVENQAYQDWLKSSRNKPKPLSFSKSFDSLRSSLSVKYNRAPWVPNKDGRERSQTKIN